MHDASILSSTNSFIAVNLANAGAATNSQTYSNEVLTTADGTSTGQLCYPVKVVASTNGGGAASTSALFVVPKQYTAASSFALGGATTAQTVFTLTAGQRGFIQNHATVPLNVKYGAAASATSLSYVLKGASTALDGTGGSLSVDDWVGPVGVFPQSGTSSYSAWVLS